MNIYIYFFFVITHFLIQYLDIHGPLGRGEGGYEYIYIFFFCDNLLSYPVPGHSWPIGEGGGGTHPLHLSLYRPVRESSAASKIFRKVQFV